MTGFHGSIEGGQLRNILETITVLLDRGQIGFEKDKVTIRGGDASGTALVEIELESRAFSDVSIGERNVYTDFSEMERMVHIGGKEEKVKLQLEEHSIELQIGDITFTLALVDPGTVDRDVSKPDLDLTSEVVLNSDSFEKGIEASQLVADHVAFGVSEEHSAFYMKSKGDVNKVVFTKKKQDLTTITLDEAESTYSVELLSKICKAVPSDEEIHIRFGNDFPAEIGFELADGACSVTYFISPRLGPK